MIPVPALFDLRFLLYTSNLKNRASSVSSAFLRMFYIYYIDAHSVICIPSQSTTSRSVSSSSSSHRKTKQDIVRSAELKE